MPLSKGSGSTARALSFSAICRDFSSGGTRIRTGDTMIFRHIQKPSGMRQILIGRRIYVHRVPLDTSWFCPYCCATVDPAFIILRGTESGMRTSACLTRLSGYTRPPLSSRDVSRHNHKVAGASCIVSRLTLTGQTRPRIAQRRARLQPGRSGAFVISADQLMKSGFCRSFGERGASSFKRLAAIM